MHQALGWIMTEEVKRWFSPAVLVSYVALATAALTGVTWLNRLGETDRTLALALADERNDRVDWQTRHTDDTERRLAARDKAQAEVTATLNRITDTLIESRLAADRLTSRISAIEAAKPRTDAVMDDLQKSVNALTNAVNLLGQRLEER